MVRPHLFGPWRRTFQWSVASLLAIIPFLSINGVAMLRLDIPTLSMELAGHYFRIEELYLAWIFILALIFLFILTTLILGRVWCGWACPQTAISDIADWLSKHKPLRRIRHFVFALISLWLGATCVWYFMPPAQYIKLLAAGQLGVWPLGTSLVVAGLVWIDLTFIRRLFCRDFCPYGRFQTILLDKGTLTLQALPEEMSRCIDCKSCLRVCPAGIDIRNGYQIECINCARCLDACRSVMAKRGEEGILRYTFGQDNLGWRAIISTKTVAIALIVMLIGGSAFFLARHRPVANFKIGRAAQLPSRLTDNGRQRTFFSGVITNRRDLPEVFTLSVSDNNTLAIKGPTSFSLTANEKRNLTLAIDSPRIPGPAPLPITFTLTATGDGSKIAISAHITPASNSGNLNP